MKCCLGVCICWSILALPQGLNASVSVTETSATGVSAPPRTNTAQHMDLMKRSAQKRDTDPWEFHVKFIRRAGIVDELFKIMNSNLLKNVDEQDIVDKLHSNIMKHYTRLCFGMLVWSMAIEFADARNFCSNPSQNDIARRAINAAINDPSNTDYLDVYMDISTYLTYVTRYSLTNFKIECVHPPIKQHWIDIKEYHKKYGINGGAFAEWRKYVSEHFVKDPEWAEHVRETDDILLSQEFKELCL